MVANGANRGQLSYLGLAASLREGVVSYLFMIPLGGAYDSENIPLPAVLGERTYSACNECNRSKCTLKYHDLGDTMMKGVRIVQRAYLFYFHACSST